MTAVSWKNNADGTWSTAANWSTGVLPAAADDVTISVSTAHTITHAGANDTISSLYTSSLATLALTGGSLTVRGTSTFYGAVTQSAGTLSLGPDSYSGNLFTQTAGTLKISSGILRLDGTGDSFAGTITGSGVNFESGTDLLAAGAVISVGELQVSGATVTLGANLAFGGGFAITSGTLALGGNTLTLSGNAALDGGATSGAGTIATTGKSTVTNFYLTGSSALVNSGVITASGNLAIGYYGTDTAHLQNAAGGTIKLLANSAITGVTNSSFTNAGALIKAGGAGNSAVNLNTASTGTITVAAGTLTFSGTNDSFGGSIGGSGTIAFSGGSDLLGNGLSLTAGAVLLSGAAVTLGGNLAYAGDWSQTAGSLSLGGFGLAQSGDVVLDGGYVLGAGTMTVTGTTELAGSYLSGSVNLVNKGAAVQTATFYDGSSGADTTKIVNAAGATYDIAGNWAVYGATGAGFTNAGVLSKSGGTGIAVIGVSTTSTGTISISQGTLRFTGPTNAFGGTVSGAGTLELNAGADKINKTALTVGGLLLDGATVTLGVNTTYAGRFTQTAGTLAMGGRNLTLSNASFEGGLSNGAGTLAVSKATNFSGGALEGSVVLSNGGSLTVAGTIYIGYNGSDTAKLMNKAGATVSLVDNAVLYGGGASTIVNAGTLVKTNGGGSSYIQDSTTSTGTITVNTGTLRFAGATNSFAGVIGGAGTIELSAGSDTLAAATTVSVGRVLLDGANLTLAGAIGIAGQFHQTAGTLALGGQTLSLSGAASFEGGDTTGSGTISASGATTAYSLAMEGSTVFTNSGVLTDTNVIYDGYYSSDTAQLINQSAGVIKLLTGTQIANGGASSFSNAGTLIKTGSGASYIGTSLSNTGTMNVAQGTLRLSGASSTLGGSVIGAGTLELYGGAVALNTVSLVGGSVLLDGATVTLGANVSTAAAWSQTAGVLALGGHTLTLTGTGSLDGGAASGSGRIVTSGNTEAYNYYVEGSVVLANSGSLTVAANTVLYAGGTSSDTATISNLAGGSIELLGNAGIGNDGAGSFTNAGTLVADGSGTKYVTPATVNTGRIEVGQGSLTFQGTVGGAGGFTLDTGSRLTFAAAVTGGAPVTMGADTTLQVSSTAGFGDIVGGFASGDLIDLSGFGFNTSAPPTLSFNAGTDKLTVTQGTTSFALTFAGTHTGSEFLAINDQGTIGIVHS